MELRIVITCRVRFTRQDSPWSGDFQFTGSRLKYTGCALIYLPNFYLGASYQRGGSNCLHPGLGKVMDGVQLHVVKYRATLLTFAARLLTNMEARGRDVH